MTMKIENSAPSVLELDSLCLTLGRFTLGPVSLRFVPGDYFLLMGPSGCGKTTLLKTLAGVHRPDSGELRIGGAVANQLSPQRRGIGYVAQHALLFPHLSVHGNIAYGLQYRPEWHNAERERRFKRAVEITGVGTLLDRRPATLSGGESRRVALARSLAVAPRVLLLDEPLGMLDASGRDELLAALRRAHEETAAVTIHVTHHADEAWALRGRCGLMRDGRLEQTGDIGELVRRPQTRFVAEFFGGRNLIPARFTQHAGSWTADLGWARLQLTVAPPANAALVQLRPETLQLLPEMEMANSPAKMVSDSPSFENRKSKIENSMAWPGMVKSAIDRGTFIELTVGLDAGPELSVHELARHHPPATGSRVRVSPTAPPAALAEKG